MIKKGLRFNQKFWARKFDFGLEKEQKSQISHKECLKKEFTKKQKRYEHLTGSKSFESSDSRKTNNTNKTQNSKVSSTNNTQGPEDEVDDFFKMLDGIQNFEMGRDYLGALMHYDLQSVSINEELNHLYEMS